MPKRQREPIASEIRIDTPMPTKESILSQTVPFVRQTRDQDFDSSKMSKIITWNVNGLRAVLKTPHFASLFRSESPDIVCLQETKLSHEIKDLNTLGAIDGYIHYDCVAAKSGYSGTRVYIKKAIEHKVLGYSLFFDPKLQTCSEADEEGRVIIIEFSSFVLVNTYVPNAGDSLKRLDFRVSTWDVRMDDCLKKLGCYVESMQTPKSLIWAGDLNVAERDYDRYFQKNYIEMSKVAGFSPEERSSFRKIIEKNAMVDCFREIYPKAAPVYSFWSYRINGRKNGQGWRLDYFVTKKSFMHHVLDTFMLSNLFGSDHCACSLWLKQRL